MCLHWWQHWDPPLLVPWWKPELHFRSCITILVIDTYLTQSISTLSFPFHWRWYSAHFLGQKSWCHACKWRSYPIQLCFDWSFHQLHHSVIPAHHKIIIEDSTILLFASHHRAQTLLIHDVLARELKSERINCTYNQWFELNAIELHDATINNIHFGGIQS